MSAQSRSRGTVSLSLSPDEHWTLHHVLLHRIDRERTTEDPTGIDPPELAVYQAFESIDAGYTEFTDDQLAAMAGVVSEYHHSTSWWETERSTLEALLRTITSSL
ncbi:DUF7853 family protein [Natronorarus salvus]|uniref:DUF7853 family protein n=1 Tax=Natronorarus salvus TaxID=3117733 RepID=UPI002F2609A9